jgi:hypothetical protein
MVLVIVGVLLSALREDRTPWWERILVYEIVGQSSPTFWWLADEKLSANHCQQQHKHEDDDDDDEAPLSTLWWPSEDAIVKEKSNVFFVRSEKSDFFAAFESEGQF